MSPHFKDTSDVNFMHFSEVGKASTLHKNLFYSQKDPDKLTNPLCCPAKSP